MLCTPDALVDRLAAAGRLWLFLDYDGTLAEFAPTPDVVEPQAEVVDLLARALAEPRIRPTIVSGRRLSHVQSLLPVAGLFMAGSYGVEMAATNGEQILRAVQEQIRPPLDTLKPRLEHAIDGHRGFFLEDKGWTLAVHGRRAAVAEADAVLESVVEMMTETAATGPFRVLGGYKFAEIGPTFGHKGETVKYLLETYPWPGATLVYVGDDERDEEAFTVVKEFGGLTIVVAREAKISEAECRLESPAEVRAWLGGLLDRFAAKPPLEGEPNR